MAVKIRLTRIGKKNKPAYRIVVANARSPRNGKIIEIIGHYNPSVNPVSFKLNKERFDYWKGVGAQLTEAVKKLSEGKYEFIHYKPKDIKEEEEPST